MAQTITQCGKSFAGTLPRHGILANDDSSPYRDDRPMTVFSMARLNGRDWLRTGHMPPIALASLIAVAAITAVAYLLWPTWDTVSSDGPERLAAAIRGPTFLRPAAA